MEDLISNLPDSLITHIISCLPTKDAVRTSVLSKKWINHWISITKLDLDDGVFYSLKKKKSGGKQNFINFVSRILLLTPRYNVESLSLVITKDYDAFLLNTWIFCILEKSVKNICINANCEVPFSALTSHYLFNHAYYLEELVLKMCCCAIKVPSSPYGYFTFGSLKVLNLCAIVFTIEESLVIHLPVLTKFKTKNCFWLSAYDVAIQAPQLKTVCIKEDFKPSTRELRSCKIKFSASCLKEFTYCGHGGIMQPIVLSNPSVAYNAYVNIIIYKRGSIVDREIGSGACLLLKQFSQVKCIKFHIWGEALTQQKIAVLPTFAMLSHLDLGFVSGGVLLSFLQKTPVLNTLVFQGISKFNQELLNSAVVPSCLAYTLQVVKFDNARGSEPELFLAKFLMENCIVLERMSFYLVNGRKGKSQVIEEFKDKLYLFKKEVSSAILDFD